MAWELYSIFKGDVYGAKYLTILDGGSLGTISGKFRGANLQADADSEVYIKSGIYSDKVSAVSYTGSNVTYTGTLAKTTGHMYISGGSFTSDITGFGMAQSGNYTANTDIHITGNISSLSASLSGVGVYGGMSGASGGIGNLYGNTSVTVSGSGKTNFVVGGNRRPGDLIGTSKVNIINGGTVSGIVGGNYIADIEESNVDKNLTSTLDGNIEINIDGGKVNKSDSSVISGIIAGGINTTVTGSATTNIKNGTVSAGIVAGNAGWGTLTMNNSQINISGGSITASGSSSYTGVSIENQIYAGSLAFGVNKTLELGSKKATIDSSSNLTITNGTSVNITGGSITGNIFGGGYAEGSDDTHTGTMTVNGGSKIVVDVQNDTTINGNIYAGGNQGTNGTSIVNDGTVITFKNNNNANFTFSGTVSGNGLNNAIVNGTKEFNFDSYLGAFNGTISDFDNVFVKASDVLFNGTFSNTTNLTIFENSVFTVANSNVLNGINLINNGKLIITEFDTSTSTTLKGEAEVKVDENLFIAVDSSEGVTINSVTKITTETDEGFAEIVENGDFVAFDAFDFDIDLTAGETVTLSFYVEKEGLSVDNFVIYHKENGEWSVAKDVSNIKYEDGYLFVDVSHFSGYGYVASEIPEPAEVAAVIGILAIGFAVYRRRK